MSASLDASLRAEMARWESRGLRRTLDSGPATPIARELEFTSNDYLSLSTDARVVDAARAAIEQFGVGGRAARLLGGGCELDGLAESACAEWLGAEAGLLFPSGYQANCGLLSALAPSGSAIFSDRLNHASIIDAARLSRARVHVFDHVDVAQLESLLAAEMSATRRIVVTESVFSMDGDLAPLAQMHDLCVRYDAYLVVDEAHAVGLIGRDRAGACGDLGSNSARLAARLVTGGKALGVTGAFVTGSRALRDHLVNHARSFVFTTGLSPAVSGALVKAIEIARSDATAAQQTLAGARAIAKALQIKAPGACIVPFVVGASAAATALGATLAAEGFDVRAVRPPTVPEGSARLRIACHAHNSIDATARLSARLLREPRSDIVIRPKSRGARTLFVIGTDTDVGKTVVSALLARAASKHGDVTYWKPVQTGTTSDTAEVERLAGSAVSLARPRHEFALPASPHAAAQAERKHIDIDELRFRLVALQSECNGILIVELAGGLLVPYDDATTQAEFLKGAEAEIVLVARSGLGTLNHTLLTLEALNLRGMRPKTLILVGDHHASNASTLRARTGLPLYELERFERLDAAALDSWIDRNDIGSLVR
ncbi:MAG: dethiobiotin synthase [Planctomycetota bacterium]|nr:dethiobiotin synthase [Planctomycetota bacterium]